MTSTSKHIVIIGGGIVGLSTAWFCQKLGYRITVIDRNLKRRNGCSFGNAGMLVPSHIVPLAAPGMIQLGLKWMWNPQSPFYIRPRASMDLIRWMWQFKKSCTRRHVERSGPVLRDLHLRSRQLYEQLETELPGGFGLKKRGLLVLCKTPAGLDEEAETATRAIQLGVPAEVLDSTATAALDSSIKMDIHGSVFYPKDCHLSPNRLMESIETALVAGGCDFRWETESIGFTTSGGRIDAVVTNRGEITADEVVLCGGVWSSALGKELGIQLPMQAGKGYSMTLEKPAELPEICSLLHEARVAVTPVGNSLRIGGTMELSGLDESISESRIQGIIRSVPQYFPAFTEDDFQGLDAWSGLRPCPPDGMPYLGRSSRWSNLLIATGHAMMGISLALVSGDVLSNILTGKAAGIEGLSLLSPDRFG